MKKSKYIILSVALVAVILIGYLCLTGELKYLNIQTTDLSNERINGVGLNESFDAKSIEAVFGKITKTTDQANATAYEFASSAYRIAFVRVRNNKIITISGENIATEKGITSKSSFEDVIKAYGTNYKRTNYKDEMGSGDYYHITYVDKKNKSILLFEFTQIDNQERLGFLNLSKY